MYSFAALRFTLLSFIFVTVHGSGSYESLLSSRIRSKPVVLSYKSDVSLDDNENDQVSVRQPEISAPNRHTPVVIRAHAPTVVNSPDRSEKANEKLEELKQVKISPRRKAPPTHARRPSYEQKDDFAQWPKIARVKELSTILDREDDFLPLDPGPSFQDVANKKAAPAMSEARVVAQPIQHFPKQMVSNAVATKPKVDFLGLTQQMLNPVLKKFLPDSSTSPMSAGNSPFSGRGLMDILKGLGQKTGGAFASGQSGAVRGPPVPGLPALPGMPSFANSQSNVDIMGLLSNIGKRIMQKSNITSIMQADSLQKMADNLTDSLVPDMPDVDLELFMGRWFEGINSPRATEEKCIVHHYGGLTQNGKTGTYTALKIYREGSDFGQVRYSIGYAFRGGRQPGMLQMHGSESEDPQPFWIYKVGPIGQDAFGNNRYEYAVVSNWIRYPLTVLVRDPDTFKQKYEDEVLQWLEKNKFVNGLVRAFNLVQPVRYENCRYSENAFEVFG